ncbi:MAG: AAA family ATPase, partial [Promicromonosporaceae bacterium]|nr:AAA family ATPase [Promicromonosporaceae bacterium]
SGGGLHPYWPISDCPLESADDLAVAKALLVQWGRLVTQVARGHGAEAVDGVYDLARVPRTPGTINMKPEVMTMTTVEALGDRPISLDEVAVALRDHGVEIPLDAQTSPSEMILPPSEWPTVFRYCGLAQEIVKGIPTDKMRPNTHSWGVAQAVRLTAARRLGCLSEEGLLAAQEALQDRLDNRRAAIGQHRTSEVAEFFQWAVDRVACMDAEHLAAEHPCQLVRADGSVTLSDQLVGTGEVVEAGSVTDEAAVLHELARMRVIAEAKRRFTQEEAGPPPEFDAGTLAEMMARPPEPPYRVKGLIPSDGATLVTAQFKTGKTTWLLNLARSLITGEPFLGRFEVERIKDTSKVALLNFEVNWATLYRWAVKIGVPIDRLFIVNLRGQTNPFAHRDHRLALAARLRKEGVESLLVDPFGKAYPSTDQNSAGEVGAWLARLDTFTRTEVGARDLVLTTHAGWNGERVRGSTALVDWGDSLVTLTRGTSANDETRYMSALGRDVEMAEDALRFDPITMRLELTGEGSKSKATAEQRAEEAMPLVLAYIKDNPGCSRDQIEKGVPGANTAIRAARDRLVATGQVHDGRGTGRSGGYAYTVANGTLPATSPHLA